MKLYVQQTSFAAALDAVCKRISKNNVNPIYGGVLLRTGNDALELTSTNSVRSIRHTVSAQVEEPGEIVLPGELLSKYVSKMPDGPVTVAIEQGGTVVKCGRSHLRLNHMDPRLFDEFPVVESMASITMPRDLFVSMVDRASRYVLKEPTGNPQYMGVHVMSKDGLLKMLSTDGYRFFEASAHVDVGDFEATIDTEALRDMASMATADEVAMGVSESQVTMSCGSVSYVGRAISGTYPSFAMILDRLHRNTVVTVDPHDIASALARIAMVAKDNGRAVTTIGNDTVTLSASSPESGEAVAEVDADVTGPELTIGLSHRYLSEGLRSFGDTVDMAFDGPEKAVLMTAHDDCDILYLLMPMRL